MEVSEKRIYELEEENSQLRARVQHLEKHMGRLDGMTIAEVMKLVKLVKKERSI